MKDLSRRLHISMSYSEILLSGRQTPGPHLAMIIAQEFGIPVGAWFQRPQPPEEDEEKRAA